MSYKRHTKTQASKDPRKKHRLSAITEMVFEYTRKLESGKTSIHTQFGHMHLHMHSAHKCTLTHTHNICPGNTEKKRFIWHLNVLGKISSIFTLTLPITHIPHPHLLWHQRSSKNLEKQIESPELMQLPVQIYLCSVFFPGILLNFLSLNVFIIDTMNNNCHFQILVLGYIQ